ncbi:MAG: ABC transporter ATP-binding protein [Actinomycetota bacterium]|nr:ABC transporter ATP-binding protein [Actinomycetota bacterium]MDH4352660.1 ABC transporter ATP-binding protein [Actinomycetota bacterium]MDH5277626.1 ABC transporter ATP-binding protein [Actinomycetota bacterium]
MGSQPVLRCSGLVKRFAGLTAVDDVGFTIAAGQTYGLLGPNGAGKTTTISMVCGLLARDAGEVQVAGRPVGPGATDAKAAIGLVPQDIALYPDLSARENLRFFGKLQGMSGKALDARIGEVLDVVGLADRAKGRIDTYSGGMKRRANIAVGLLHEPKLLVLDEPTVGVDPQSRNAILESVAELGGRGLAVLYTTHYMEEAERLCDRIGIIDAGRIVAEGTREELVASIGQVATIRLAARVDETVTDADEVFGQWLARTRALPAVDAVRLVDHALELDTADGARLIAPAVEAAEGLPLAVTTVTVSEPDLETVFLRLTGKALRD